MVPLSIQMLHIPDGFLSLTVAAFFWVLTLLVLAVAVRRSQTEFDERLAPLAGVMAAFIFAAQMINFPIIGGTSGHLLGGVLAAVVLGPWVGMVVMACVIGVQALLFQDGGLLVMGANIFNMGIVTVLIGYGLYRAGAGRSWAAQLALVGVAAWLSVMAAALLTALQLWLSGTAYLGIIVPAMLGVHALIGVGEAVITVAALAFIRRARPDLLQRESQASDRGWIIGGVVVSLLVVLLAPLASAYPDGLERVAEDLGFMETAVSSPYELLPDYTFPFIGSESLSTLLAGLVGVLIVAGLVLFLIRAIRRAPAQS